MKKKVYLFRAISLGILSFLSSVTTNAQMNQEVDGTPLKCTVFFHRSECEIVSDYRDNGTHLETLLNSLKAHQKVNRLVKLQILASASPEGPLTFNDHLAVNRALALKNYIQSRLGLPESMFEIVSYGQDWTGLRSLVASSAMPAREEVISIIDAGLEEVDGRYVDNRKSRLESLNGGRTWAYMDEHFFPDLRRSAVVHCLFEETLDNADVKKVAAPCECANRPVQKDTIFVMSQPQTEDTDVIYTAPVTRLHPLPHHYISAGFESPYMFGDMYSFTRRTFNLGIGANLRYGYRINSHVGVEVKAMYGRMRGESTLSGAANLLGTNGRIYYWKDDNGDVVTFRDLIGSEAYTHFSGYVDGAGYKGIAKPLNELYVNTRMAQLGVMLVFNMNRLFTDVPDGHEQRVTLYAKPGIYATKYWSSIYDKATGKVWQNQRYTRPVSPSAGLELSLNIALCQYAGVELFANGLWVTDKRYDGISHERISHDDFITAAGLNLQFKF